MHFLEEDNELLETLPPELKAQCCEMREIDSKVEKGLTQIREASRELFDMIDNLSTEEKEAKYQKIKTEYSMIRELSEEKVHIAEFLHTMMEKYGDRISKDLTEFKYELEADSPGVTLQIEQEFFDKERAVIASRKDKSLLGCDDDMNDDDILLRDDFLPSTSKLNGHLIDGKGTSTPEILSMRSRSSTATSLEHMPPPKRRLTTKQFELGKAMANKSTDQYDYRSNSSSASTTPKAQSPAPPSRRYPPNVLPSPGSYGSLPGTALSTSQSQYPGSQLSALASPLPTFVSTQESRHGRPIKKTTKIQKMIEGDGRRIGRPPGSIVQSIPSSPGVGLQRKFVYSESETDIPTEDAEDEEEEGEEDNRTWCFCNRETFGDMIACDNKNCRYEWFHYECVGISAPPKGKWYCSECQQLIDSRSSSIEKR